MGARQRRNHGLRYGGLCSRGCHVRQRAVRQDNLRTWAMAGRMLGVKPVELKELPERENPGGGGGDFTFAPQIIIQGNADRSVIDEALAEAKAQFEAWYLQMQRKQARTAY